MLRLPLIIITRIDLGSGSRNPCWHNIVCFGDPAKALAEFRKGAVIRVEAKIQYDEWEDSEGKKRTATKIVCFVI